MEVGLVRLAFLCIPSYHVGRTPLKIARNKTDPWDNQKTNCINSLNNERHERSQNSTFNKFDGLPLETLQPITERELLKLLKDCKPTTCELDPIPTTMILEYSDILIGAITSIINMSLESGSVSEVYKEVLVRPLIKKPGSDENNMKNYRPVSNLPFMSKLLEKAVKVRLSTHLTDNNLLEKFQSAYRPRHSTRQHLFEW